MPARSTIDARAGGALGVEFADTNCFPMQFYAEARDRFRGQDPHRQSPDRNDEEDHAKFE